MSSFACGAWTKLWCASTPRTHQHLRLRRCAGGWVLGLLPRDVGVCVRARVGASCLCCIAWRGRLVPRVPGETPNGALTPRGATDSREACLIIWRERGVYSMHAYWFLYWTHF